MSLFTNVPFKIEITYLNIPVAESTLYHLLTSYVCTFQQAGGEANVHPTATPVGPKLEPSQASVVASSDLALSPKSCPSDPLPRVVALNSSVPQAQSLHASQIPPQPTAHAQRQSFRFTGGGGGGWTSPQPKQFGWTIPYTSVSSTQVRGYSIGILSIECGCHLFFVYLV